MAINVKVFLVALLVFSVFTSQSYAADEAAAKPPAPAAGADSTPSANPYSFMNPCWMGTSWCLVATDMMKSMTSPFTGSKPAAPAAAPAAGEAAATKT